MIRFCTQRAAVGGLCNLAMSDTIIERMLDRNVEGHERYMKIFLVIAHSPDEQAAVYHTPPLTYQLLSCIDLTPMSGTRLVPSPISAAAAKQCSCFTSWTGRAT